jgi:hypothetical protein
MGGRYRLSRRKQFIAEHFDATGDDDWEPHRCRQFRVNDTRLGLI